MDIAIHINPTQPHQAEHAGWFREGFKRHGLNLTVTSNLAHEADVHIVSGPHYANARWQNHPRTILIDRALYHDEKTGRWHSMDWISAAWLKADGGRHYTVGTGKTPPLCRDQPKEGGVIFLADYNGKAEEAEPGDTVRLHPDNCRYEESLTSALRRHRTARGHQTSALVTAALEGLEVECTDSRNIVAQPGWLELLPYADWRHTEIQAGDLWDHLRS